MKTPAHNIARWLLAAILASSCCAPGPARADEPPGVAITIKLPDVDRIELQRHPDLGHRYVVSFDDGRVESFAPDAFALLVDQRINRLSWFERLCNVSSPIGFLWVGLGLLGQVLFTGRLLVQWLVSERQKRSVIPVAFWWMSLAGGALLLIYFTWRRDLVGFLGQATGFTIYSRNLILIYSHRREVTMSRGSRIQR